MLHSRFFFLLLLTGLLVVFSSSAAMAWEEAVVLSASVGTGEDDPDWVVQAQVFPTEAEAWELSDSLLAKGLEPYVFAAADEAGMFRYSVRLGVYETLYHAIKASAEFQGHWELDASVTEDGSFEPLSLTDKVFFLQVMALSLPEKVSEAVAEYQAKGYAPGVVKLLEAGQEWSIVYVDAYEDFSEADQAATEFRSRENSRCYLIMMDRALFDERNVTD